MSIAADLELVETDGEPLESDWHRAQINLLIEVLSWLLRERNDYYVGGNMFIYYSEEQARNRDYRGPDFFYVEGVNRLPPRPYWAVWQEGNRYPNFIIELMSPTTAAEDRTTKKDIYEQIFRTPEYCCYDPDTRELQGWRLGRRSRRYRPIPPNEHGWLWIEELELWLGTWQGKYLGLEATWLRFYDAEGKLVPTQAEAVAQQADAARQEAEAAVQRAETAEAELARLQARLQALENKQ